MNNTQSNALRLADALDGNAKTNWTREEAAAELRRQHARIAEMEAQLSSSGFTAADMATAAAQGFRDGVASVAANAGEPVAWQYRSLPDVGGVWFECSKERAEQRAAHPERWEVRPLYAAPPTAQAEGWISVQDELPKCSKKPDSFGVEVLIWPPNEDGSRTAFYGRRQSREPNFYKYGALLGHVEFWRYPPLPPTSAEGVEHG